MHTYEQSTGRFLVSDSNFVGLGYSGYGVGKNNRAMEGVANVGPIPRGEWTIVGQPFDDPEHGPFALRLEPKVGTSTLGRAGFLIHGDSLEHPGCASKGCIIQGHAIREAIHASGCVDLEVV